MHNGSVLPPFRFPKLAKSLVEGLLSFAESKGIRTEKPIWERSAITSHAVGVWRLFGRKESF